MHSLNPAVHAVLAAGVAGLAMPALAELTFEPSAALTVLYTDNVRLAEKGSEEEDIVYALSPSLRVAGSGNRYDLDLLYRLDLIGYTELDETSVYNDLNSRLNLRLLGDNLFLNSRAVVTQVIKEPTEAVSFDNLPLTGNRTNQTVLETTPEWRQQFFGHFFRTAYTVGRVDYGDSDLRDSDYQLSSTQVASPGVDRGLGWAMDHLYHRYEYDELPDFRRQQLQLNVYWELGGGWAPFGTVGRESDWRDREGTSLEDSIWLLGLRHNTERTRFSVSAGRRSFGETYAVSFDRQYSQDSGDVFSISYVESPTTSEERLRDLSLIVDPGLPGLPPDVQAPGTGDAFVQRRATVRIRKQLNRSGLALGGYIGSDTSIVRAEDGGQRRRRSGADFSWDYRWGERTSSVLTALYSREEFGRDNLGAPIEDNLWRLRLALNYELGQRTRLRLWVARNERTGSETRSRDYTENQVGLSLNRNFY